MSFLDINNFLHYCAAVINPSYGLAVGLFVMGLIGGVTHCAGMCGPFVLSQSVGMTKLRDMALIPYHMGRIVTYIILGIIMYSLVNMVTFYAPLRLFVTVPLLILAGLLFFVNAFPSLLVIFPWVGHIRLPISQDWIGKASMHTSKRFFLGMILGLMPCGMVMAALIAASTAPTMVSAAGAVAAFGSGTIPALIAMAAVGGKMNRNYPETMQAVRQGLMVWSGVWLFLMAGLMVMRG